jgi:hypothetical protein
MKKRSLPGSKGVGGRRRVWREREGVGGRGEK